MARAAENTLRVEFFSETDSGNPTDLDFLRLSFFF